MISHSFKKKKNSTRIHLNTPPSGDFCNSLSQTSNMAKPSLSIIHLIIFVIVISSLPSFQSKPLPRFLGKFSRSSPHNSERRHQHSKPIQYETRYFPQNLDHFSFSDTPKFQQRYLVNSEHWVGPQRHGPIFLYCGNEGDIVWFAENTGFVWDLAPRFGAMVLFPEVSFCFFFFCRENEEIKKM